MRCNSLSINFLLHFTSTDFPCHKVHCGFFISLDGNLRVPAHIADLFWDSWLEFFCVIRSVWMEINLIMSQRSEEEQSPAPEGWRSGELVTATWQQTSSHTHLNQKWDKCKKKNWSCISEIHFYTTKIKVHADTKINSYFAKCWQIWDLVWKCVSSSNELPWKNVASNYN